MEEEKNLNVQDDANAVDENAAAEIVEEIVDDVKEAVDEVKDEVAEVADDVTELAEEAEEIIEQVKAKGSSTLVAVIVTAVVMAIIGFVLYQFVLNPYNANCKYAMTLEQYAQQMGQTVEDVKTEYSFPKNMPGNTYVAVAEFYIPLSVYMEQQAGITIDEWLEQMQGMYSFTPEEIEKIKSEDAILGDLELVMRDVQQRMAEATPDPNATPEPISQEEAEEIAKAIMGDAATETPAE